MAPCSPDLNPIENLWAILKQRIAARKPSNKQELEEVAKEVWANISLDTIQKTIKQLPPRLKKVIEKKGGHSNK